MNRKNLIASIMLAASLLTVGTAISVRATTNPALSFQSTFSSCSTSSTSTWYSTGFGVAFTPGTTGRIAITAVATVFYNTGSLSDSSNFRLYLGFSTVPSCNTSPTGLPEGIQIPDQFSSPYGTFRTGVVTLQGVQTGLAVGTTYYAYVAYQMIQGTPGGFGSGTIIVQET